MFDDYLAYAAPYEDAWRVLPPGSELAHQAKGTIAVNRGNVALVLLLRVGAGRLLPGSPPVWSSRFLDFLALAGITNAARVIAYGEIGRVLNIVCHNHGKGASRKVEL